MVVISVGRWRGRGWYYRVPVGIARQVLPTGYYGWSGKDLGVVSRLEGPASRTPGSDAMAIIVSVADGRYLLRGEAYD